MKCPNCWDQKVHVREMNFLHRVVCAVLFLVPMRCRHCFHAFYVSRLSSWKTGGERETGYDNDENPSVVKFPAPAQKRNEARTARRRAA